MSEQELQNDEAVIETDNTEVESQEVGTDLAPVSDAEHEEKPQVDEEAAKQEAIQKAINKKHFEAKQAERERDEALAKVAEFEQKKREELAAQAGNIPPLPDPFDDDYEQQLKAREDALIAQANYNAQNQAYLHSQQIQQQQEAQAKQQAQAKLEQDFLTNARSTGAKDDEIVSVVNTLVQAGLQGDLGSAIMADKDGFFIAKHLAENPMEAYELSTMNPILAGAKYAELRSKASALKPQVSKAPKPVTNLQGNGVDPELGKYKYLDGATFE